MKIAARAFLITAFLGCAAGTPDAKTTAPAAAPVDVNVTLPVAASVGAESDAGSNATTADSDSETRSTDVGHSAAEGFPPLPTDGKPIGIQAMNISDRAKRHIPKVLDGPLKPTKIANGTYGCRVSAEYNLRPCEVTRDSRGWAWLEMPHALVALRGVIYDDGPNTVVFEGAPIDRRPFGCFSCDARCTANPDSCFCKELLEEASRRCLEQTASIRFTRQGANWAGSLSWETYFNEYKAVNTPPSGFEMRPQKLPVLIAPHPKKD